MNTSVKHKISPKSFGKFLIVYGILYVLWDRIDFLIQTYYDTNMFLCFFFPEPHTFRMINIIFCTTLITGGYFLIQKRKEAWYLINFGSIGILSKYLYSFLFVQSSGNFLSWIYIHATIAILSLKLINSVAYKSEICFESKKQKKTFRFMFGIAFSIIIFYGFEHSWWHLFIDYNSKHYRNMVYESNRFYPEDTCYFANEFCSLIDTLKNVEDFTSLIIVQVDSNLIPQYAEELNKYDDEVSRQYFFYDSAAQEITYTKYDDWDDKIDTVILAYDYTKDFIKLPKLNLRKDEHEKIDFFQDSTKPMVKMSSIYTSDSKRKKEQIVAIFVESKPEKPPKVYCIFRPWYIRLIQFRY